MRDVGFQLQNLGFLEMEGQRLYKVLPFFVRVAEEISMDCKFCYKLL